MNQRSPEWFKARCGRITGSRFAAVMALGKKGQPLAERRDLVSSLVLERLTGNVVSVYQNEAMTWGLDNEPKAKDWYMFEKSVVIDEVAFIVHPVLDFVGVSPDGLVDEEGGCEIKCPYNMERHLTNIIERKVPEEYLWQVQGCMWVSNREWWDFISYDPRFPAYLQGVVVRMYRDDKLIDQLENECNEVHEEVETQLEKLK